MTQSGGTTYSCCVVPCQDDGDCPDGFACNLTGVWDDQAPDHSCYRMP
jgi:hypothetical protein